MNGLLIVISGLSGSGKDYIVELLLKNPYFKSINLSRVVTNTDRNPRDGERDGYHYHFVSTDKMNKMYQNNELVEKPVLYGTSHKATSKKELEKVLDGENKIWRIDPTLLLKIAEGKFFNEMFDRETAEKFRQKMLIIFTVSPQEQLINRRKKRDKDQYSEDEYKKRSIIDQQILEKLKNTDANIIDNFDNRANEAVEKIIALTQQLDS